MTNPVVVPCLNSYTDENTEDYDREAEILGEMFPNAKFVVSLSLSELDNVICDSNEVHIVYRKDCVCCGPCNDEATEQDRTITYEIRSKNNACLTYKYVLKQLEKQGFNPWCNHIFIEGFDEIGGTRVPTYEMILGS